MASGERPEVPLLHDLIIKVVGVLCAIGGLVRLYDVFAGDDLLLMRVIWFCVSLLLIGSGIGLVRYRGWAYLVFSALLLLSWIPVFMMMIIGFSTGDTGAGSAMAVQLVLIMAAIAYFGRWSMERRFRPHLDVDS